ncbi:unnamed protein product [Rhizopus stolonifer]
MVMATLVYSILLYTCYEAVFHFVGPTFTNDLTWYMANQKTTLRAVTTISLCATSLFCYSKIMLQSTTKISSEYHVPKDYPLANKISLCDSEGEPLYCYKCELFKPERTHHCSVCDQCTPKMDHHCVWLNGCVDETNYKCFFLFVMYVSLYALSGLSLVLPLMHQMIKREVGKITLSLCWSIYKTYISCIFHILWNVLQMIKNRQWISLLTGVEGVNTNISYHLCIATFLQVLFGLKIHM